MCSWLGSFYGHKGNAANGLSVNEVVKIGLQEDLKKIV